MSDPAPAKLADTPVATTSPPPPLLERMKGLVGDLARPFGLYATFGATAVAIVETAKKVTSSDAAVYLTALFAGLGVLFVSKSWENSQESKHNASVAIAQAATPSTVTV